jgi:serine/threonine protein kinase
MVDLVGTSLGHFRIEAQLGEGGMGVVYRATDEKLGRQVALKVLPESFAPDDEPTQRFLREARSAAAVTHANIATVYEVGESAGHVFIAMELVEGETLRARLERGLSVEEAIRIGKDIASGLARAHERGIIHRDLKPENVMITRHEEVKILDFGLAKQRPEETVTPSVLGTARTELQLTQDGLVLGTPAYMSPEQAMGEPVDARADVFSFGVLFYEMLTGTRPFQGATAIAVLLAASRDPAKPPSVKNPQVPVEVDRIALRCLQRKDAGRYANGRELLEALRVILPEARVSGAGASLMPGAPGTLKTPLASSGVPGPRAPQRWGLLAILGLACLAAAGLGFGFQRLRAAPATASAVPSAIASASAVAAAPIATTLTDLPPPPTKVPEAATEYAAGMQALRDNSWGSALRHFERAAELDPSMALAHLRLSMTEWNQRAVLRREEFGKAESLRAELSPRDRALLEALEPVLQRSHFDRGGAVELLERASKTYPSDVEFHDWTALLELGNPARALTHAESALRLDPKDGLAWQIKGESLAVEGRLKDSREALERCLALASDSADCLTAMSRLDALEGKCDAFQTDTRRWFDRDPTAALSFAAALLTKGRPVASALEVLEQNGPGPRADAVLRTRAALNRTKLATFAGDFTRAHDLAKETLGELSSSPTTRADFNLQLRAFHELIDPLEETGKDDEVRAVAEDFTVRSAGWATSASNIDLSFPLQRLAVGPKLSMEEFEARRAKWIVRQAAKGAYPGLVWVFAYAATALTAGEAKGAIDALPRFVPLTSFMQGQTPIEPDAYAGRTYWLAGKPAEAIPYLKRAVDNCTAPLEPAVHMHAALNLGQALEATGDKAGACAAFKVVVDRWGNAKPRSVTAEKARERAKALACAM